MLLTRIGLLALGAILIALAIGSRGVTSAQTPPGTPTPIPTPTAVPSIDPTHFALSIWEFPQPADLGQSRVESNDQAENEAAIGHFGSSFAEDGRITGYYMLTEQSNLDSKGKLHLVDTAYLTSTFGSVDAATNALNQEKNGWQQLITIPPTGVSATQVPVTGTYGDLSGGGLYIASAQSSGGTLDNAELVFERGIYMIQVFQNYLHRDAKYATADRKYLLGIAHKLDQVAAGSIAGPPKPSIPKTPALSVLSTRFEPNGLPANFQTNLSRKPVTKASAGSTVQSSVYFVVTNAPPGSHVTVTVQLARDKHAPLKRKLTQALGSYPPGYYRYHLSGIKLNLTGTYKATMRVSIAHVARSGTARLTVTKKGLQLGRSSGMIGALSMGSVRLATSRLPEGWRSLTAARR